MAHHDSPARRVPPKTAAAIRHIPLTPQLTALLRDRRLAAARSSGADWVFATRKGTPFSRRNIQRSAVHIAADAAGLRVAGARLRFHEYAIPSPRT